MEINQEDMQRHKDYLEMSDYYSPDSKDFFSNQEGLDFYSALLWLVKVKGKNFESLNENQKIRSYSSFNNCLHNTQIIRKILNKKNFSLEDIRKVFRESKERIDESGVTPINTFYWGKNLVKENLESLLKTETYSNDTFTGFKSRWIKENDNKKKLKYCMYLREDNENFSPNLKYLVENLSKKGQVKYDLVVSFDKQGIDSIKHIEVETRNFKEHELLRKYTLFPKHYQDFCKFNSSFFKEKLDGIQIVNHDGNIVVDAMLPLSEKGKVMNQNILKKEPILAGGAFRHILNFYSKNFDELQEVYNKLKNRGGMQYGS